MTDRERLRELTETGSSVRYTGRPIMTMIAEALGPDDTVTADRLIEEALFLRMNGERPPGAPQHDLKAETWHDWERRAELYLRSRPLPSVNTASGTLPNRSMED